MADLTITTSQVISVSGKVTRGTAGETITIGQALYLAADGTWMKAQHDGTAIESGAGTRVGIALSGAAASQSMLVQEDGVLTLGAGAAPTAGEIYCVSATYGGIAPEADVGAADYVTILGVGLSGNRISLKPHASGQTI